MQKIHPEAKILNDKLQRISSFPYDCLSGLGKKLFYPKGILAQSAEAGKKADKKFNATIGSATSNGKPMIFDFIGKEFDQFEAKDVFTYAPVTGRVKLRSLWREKIYRENPSLNGLEISSPIVTNGITHGLSVCADLFCDAGDTVLVPDMFWENYSLIFEVRRDVELKKFRFFNDEGRLDLVDMEKKISELGGKDKTLRLIFNFPNNPSGYNLYEDEAKGIRDILLKYANQGFRFLVVTDDAYFGLFFDDSFRQSLFSLLAGAHKNILAVKLDAATKEFFVWGFRLAFITFGTAAENKQDIYSVLETKTNGIIRASISSANHHSQTVIERALENPEYPKSFAKNNDILSLRAKKVKEIALRPEYSKHWDVYPFNSGYFMCLKLKNADAEKLRVLLLDKFSTGAIAMSEKDLRVAFCSVEVEDIPELFNKISAACSALNQ